MVDSRDLAELLPMNACHEGYRWLRQSGYTDPNEALDNAPRDYVFWLVEYVGWDFWRAISNAVWDGLDATCNLSQKHARYKNVCHPIAIVIIKKSEWWGDMLKKFELLQKRS